MPKQNLCTEVYGAVDETDTALEAAEVVLPAGQW